VYGWFERTGRGSYRLTRLGEEALVRWPHSDIDHLRELNQPSI
jgi:hypothetical protein